MSQAYILDSSADARRRRRERERLDVLHAATAGPRSWPPISIRTSCSRTLPRASRSTGHDILDGPVEEAAFDLVVARAVVVHVWDRARALRHMAAGLKPGGWLVVVDPSLPRTPRLLRVR